MFLFCFTEPLDHLDPADPDPGAYQFVSFRKKNGVPVSSKAYIGYIPFNDHPFRIFDRYDCIPVQNCVTITVPFVEIIALVNTSLDSSLDGAFAKASFMAVRNGPLPEEGLGFD
jgi:hypothetical protein